MGDCLTPVIRGVGKRHDNALMENFFSTLKTELVYRNSWRRREEAENALFSYIETPGITANASRPGSAGAHRKSTGAAWHAQQTVLDDQPATPTGRAQPA